VNKSSRLRTAIVAVSGGLAAVPAGALELGDVKIHSTLGQPLRASITYALAPNEQLADTCVSIVSSPASNGLPAVSTGSIIVTDGVIAITGTAAHSEPLASMRIAIRCPYTPQLTREYMLFVDPAQTLSAPVAQERAPTVAEPQQVVRAPATAARAEPIATAEPITIAGRYRVQPGDSLSRIAERIENRPVGLWPAVNAIFAANPDAFIDGDINRLKAGTWLDIPDFGSGEALIIAPAMAGQAAPAVATVEPDQVAEPAATAYAPAALGEPTAAAEQEPVSILEQRFETAQTTPARPVSGEVAEELEPGDVVIAPLESVADETIVIPDTALEAPVASSDEPNVPTAIIRAPASAETNSTGWLAWLAGGVALLAGLFAFGWLRSRFGSTPVGAIAAEPGARRRSTDTQRVEAIGAIDHDLGDNSPTGENLALDADLIMGTGFEDGSSVDMTEAFAFASTTELDIELPEEMSSTPEEHETDIIPPLNIDPESILESEVLPDQDDDYDMSMIVDATKMPDPAEVTERDLEAIEVPDSDETLEHGDYTLSQEVDYKILEQDYQDELTATQRLNEEIRKAAETLATSMEDNEEDTREMSMATVFELDVTAQMPSQNDDLADDDDTGVNPTVNLEAEDKTVEMTDDRTVEMPKSGKAR